MTESIGFTVAAPESTWRGCLKTTPSGATVRHGPWVVYSGKRVVSRMTFDSDQLSGPYEAWDALGHRTLKGEYRDGVPFGKWAIHGLDGRIDRMAEFVNGRERHPYTICQSDELVFHGPHVRWRHNGLVMRVERAERDDMVEGRHYDHWGRLSSTWAKDDRGYIEQRSTCAGWLGRLDGGARSIVERYRYEKEDEDDDEYDDEGWEETLIADDFSLKNTVRLHRGPYPGPGDSNAGEDTVVHLIGEKGSELDGTVVRVSLAGIRWISFQCRRRIHKFWNPLM